MKKREEREVVAKKKRKEKGRGESYVERGGKRGKL